MNPELMAQMAPLIEPPSVGWWPLASSVWISLVIVLGVLAGLITYLLQRHRNNAYRREALTQLPQWSELDDAEFLQQVNKLLKQVAISTYGRPACAGLNQSQWLAFLQSKAGFIEQPEALKCLDMRYQAQPKPLQRKEREAIMFYVKNWIKAHHL